MRCQACNTVIHKPIVVRYKDSNGVEQQTEEWLCSNCETAAFDDSPEDKEEDILSVLFDGASPYE